MRAAPSVLVVDNVSKAFVDGPQPLQALQPVSFSMADGEFVCLLGPSGSGKSTLLRIIGGLVAPDSGASGSTARRCRSPRPDIGFVFQKTNLMPWRTVMQNVLLPTGDSTKESDGSRPCTGARICWS